jgi:hypothetical protein
MSRKLAGLAGLFALALVGLPACPRAAPKGADGSSDPVKQGADGTIAPRAPVVVATGHPRLLVRESDLPRLRGWATGDNGIFDKGLKPLVEQCAQTMDAGGVATDDPASPNGYFSNPPEAYAMLFAFYSLVSPSLADRDAYAKRARTLLMSVIDKAVLGAAPDQPFRDPAFSIGDRSRWFGQGFPLAVDWIYGSLTAADKKKIRTVFLRWAKEIQSAETTTDNHPEPAGVVNDPKLTADVRRTRWAGNNYYTAHMRNLGMMAMSFDAADDPDEKLRSHLASVTGAWLYVSDALMRGDMRGGLASEGFEYSPLSVGYVAQLLLALYTAGRADPATAGKQVTFDNPFWNETIPGFLHSLSPTTKVPADPDNAYLGALHEVAWYGDGEKYWAPDYMGVFGPMGVYDAYTQNEKRLSQLRWIETNFAPGGAPRLEARANDNNDLLASIFYFLLLDPKAKPPADPRPLYPLIHFSAGLGRFLQRTSWAADATWFSYKLGWTTLDHQHADGNMFELWRKGEWLTKERTGYGDDAACTDQKNSIALQNDRPSHHDGYRGAEWKRGSQWTYVTNGDGKILASRFGADFTYFLGDATPLYNSKDEGSQDILHASRSIVWIVPDRIVTYDRAASKTAGRFKRFWMQLPSNGSVAGGLMTMKSAGGQNLFVRTLLPNPATIAVERAESLDDENGKQPAVLDPIKFRLRVEAPGSPKTVRWLHVIQGADGKDRADNSTLVSSTSGTPYQGASFNDTVVMFPVDIGPFASVSYAVPASTKAQLVTGLTPGAGYKVTTQKTGDTLAMTVAKGGDQKADGGGVLLIGKLP